MYWAQGPTGLPRQMLESEDQEIMNYILGITQGCEANCPEYAKEFRRYILERANITTNSRGRARVTRQPERLHPEHPLCDTCTWRSTLGSNGSMTIYTCQVCNYRYKQKKNFQSQMSECIHPLHRIKRQTPKGKVSSDYCIRHCLDCGMVIDTIPPELAEKMQANAELL